MIESKLHRLKNNPRLSYSPIELPKTGERVGYFIKSKSAEVVSICLLAEHVDKDVRPRKNVEMLLESIMVPGLYQVYIVSSDTDMKYTRQIRV